MVAPGTGFLLNNEMTDFGAPGTANEPEPFKRPRSSMSPTIVVRKGEPVLVTGAAGGARIIMGVLNSIVGLVDFDLNIGQALDAERVDALLGVTGPPFPLELEDGRVDENVEIELVRARPHHHPEQRDRVLRPAANECHRGGARNGQEPRSERPSHRQRGARPGVSVDGSPAAGVSMRHPLGGI